ncbi:MAG: hypothetical protein AAF913_17025 [Pseudomonadota bacterium]
MTEKVEGDQFAKAAVLAPLLGAAVIGGMLLVVLGASGAEPGVSVGFTAMILIVGLFWGVPFYVLFGLPLIWSALRQNLASRPALAGVAFVANLLAALIHSVLEGLIAGQSSTAALTLIIGSGVAPIWGACFAYLYTPSKHRRLL